MVPLEQVQTIDIGVVPKRLPWRLVQGIGYYWGQGRTEDGRVLHQFSTRPPAQSLVIYTIDNVYTLSPADREGFVQDLEQRRNLGATKPLAVIVEPSRAFLYDFWGDATVRWLLLMALVLNLFVLGLLAARYPLLEPMVRMRFDAAGQVADLRPRHQVLFLPLAAFVLTLLNMVLGLLFYRAQHVGARLLQGASVVVQFCLVSPFSPSHASCALHIRGTAKNKRAINSPKAKRVRHCYCQRRRPRGVGHIVQVAGRVGVFIVDGWWKQVML